MPRLQVIEPANAQGRVREIFDGPLKAMPINLFKGMANSAVGLDAYLGLSGALKGNGRLTPAQSEAIALRIGEENNCDYCVAAHTVLGKKGGLTEDQTVALRKGEKTGNQSLDAPVAFADAILRTKGFVSDQDIADFKAAGFDDGHIVEVVTIYALNTFTNVFNHINQTAVDFPAPPALANA